MKTKLFTALKQAYSSLGLADEILQGQADALASFATDENLDAIVEGQKTFLTSLQSGIDKRVTDAVLKAKEKKTETGGEQKKDEPKKDELPDWFRTFQAEHDELKNKLSSFEKKEANKLLSGQLMTKLKEKGISEKFIKGRSLNIEKEEDINTLLTEIEADWNDFAQEQAESGVVISIPKQSVDGLKEGEAMGKALAEKRNTGASDGVKGKEIT